MKYCNCKGCNYPDQHITFYHQCGTCNGFGHGQIECSNPELLLNIKRDDFRSITPTRQCTIIGCKKKQSHTNMSHSDSYQKQYESTLSLQDLEWMKNKLHPSCHNIINKDSFITDYYYESIKMLDKNNNTSKVFVSIYGGMGHEIIAKRDNINGPIYVTMFEYNSSFNTNKNQFTNGYIDISN